MSDTFEYFISNSELQTWKRCRRKWYLTYYRKLTPRISDPTTLMESGTRVHVALSEWYSPNRTNTTNPLEVHARLIDEASDQLIKESLPDYGGFDPEDPEHQLLTTRLNELEKCAALERAMIEGYLEWVAQTGADEEFEIIGSEMPIVVPISDFGVLGRFIELYGIGILDVRVRRKSDGTIAFLDHKTVQSLTQPIPTLRQNEQMLHYILLEEERQYGSLPERGVYSNTIPTGAYYNMIRRVKRTASAKPPFFAREFISHTQQEVMNHRSHVVGAAHDIISTGIQLRNGMNDHHELAYPSVTMNCSWDCPFFSVCYMFDDNSHPEAALAGLYKTHDPLERYKGAFNGNAITDSIIDSTAINN